MINAWQLLIELSISRLQMIIPYSKIAELSIYRLQTRKRVVKTNIFLVICYLSVFNYPLWHVKELMIQLQDRRFVQLHLNR